MERGKKREDKKMRRVRKNGGEGKKEKIKRKKKNG